MSANPTPLFACTKCNSRHPFEELSQGQQLCKDCRGSYPIVKCTFCRSEFQQELKASTATICKKCEQNVKQHGKPSACEYCNIIAAFIGSKCQRCANSEKKYGPPLTCDQCKQRCAYDRKDDDRKKVDGKLLCWLCTLSYKRALARAKHNEKSRRSLGLHKSSSGSGAHHHGSGAHKSKSHHSSKNKRHTSSSMKIRMRPDVTMMPPPEKKSALSGASGASNGSMPSMSDSSDPTSSDHVIMVTQLRENIASLQKQVSLKDQLLLTKEKQITELKAAQLAADKEMRSKMQDFQKSNAEQIDQLQQKIKSLQKQVSTLSKRKGHGNVDSPQQLLAV